MNVNAQLWDIVALYQEHCRPSVYGVIRLVL